MSATTASTSIPAKMKAVQILEYNQPYQIREVDVPSRLGPRDLLVKVAVASFCHTDGMVQAGLFGTRLPSTASHEGSGTVVATGPEVTRFRAGDRVMVGLPTHACGVCADCTGPEDQRQYCRHTGGHTGVQRDGCFAEYVLLDEAHTTLLPDGISFLSAAPLACAGRTVWRAVRLADLCPGQWLAVVGSGGGLGHIGVQFAKALGLRVIGIDARDEGLALSRESGADVVLDARRDKAEVASEVRRIVGGDGGGMNDPRITGADATINLADAPSAAALACAVTRMHGTMVQIAQPPELVVPYQEVITRDVRIRGSILSSAGESQAMVDFITGHSTDIKVKAVPFRGLDSIYELVKLVQGGKIQGKAAVIVDAEQVRTDELRGLPS